MRFLTRCSTVVQSHPAQFPMAEGEGEEEWLEEEGEEEEVVEVVEDDDDCPTATSSRGGGGPGGQSPVRARVRRAVQRI